MADHGILFSAPMIQALLAGRKTVTRRFSSVWMRVKVGDVLWVRETFAVPPGSTTQTDAVYRADLTPEQAREELSVKRLVRGTPSATPWTPSIHMPRWASRITLRATQAPRREPVQSITEDEAKREGVTIAELDPFEWDRRRTFQALWGDLHTKPGERWEDNPTVTRIAFERVE